MRGREVVLLTRTGRFFLLKLLCSSTSWHKARGNRESPLFQSCPPAAVCAILNFGATSQCCGSHCLSEQGSSRASHPPPPHHLRLAWMKGSLLETPAALAPAVAFQPHGRFACANFPDCPRWEAAAASGTAWCLRFRHPQAWDAAGDASFWHSLWWHYTLIHLLHLTTRKAFPEDFKCAVTWISPPECLREVSLICITVKVSGGFR